MRQIIFVPSNVTEGKCSIICTFFPFIYVYYSWPYLTEGTKINRILTFKWENFVYLIIHHDS